MALPFDETNPVRKTYFIDESERDVVTPANDAGKVPQLSSDGKLDGSFFRSVIRREYTAGATWNKPVGVTKVFIRVQAKGGNGGNGNNFASPSLGGGGGGGGAYAEKSFSPDDLAASETIVIDGTKASFGAHVECTVGANGITASSGSFAVQLGGNGGVATGGDVNINGQPGASSSYTSSPLFSGDGGASVLGFGGRNVTSANSGKDGVGYGSGASGGCGTNLGQFGGVGSPAIIEVFEYYA